VDVPELEPVASLATQNAGTTLFLGYLAESPLRTDCDDWYVDDLCTLDTEAAVAAALAEERPDVVMLQEVWDQTRCAEEGRPDRVGEPPFVCAAGGGHQLGRVLPEDYSYACAPGRRDALTCVTWRSAVFQPEPPDAGAPGCRDRDCSEWLQAVETECDRGGRLAWLRGRSAHGPTALAVFHPKAGFKDPDITCRAQQLQEASEALALFPADGMLVVAGDFNLNPDGEAGPDVQALQALLERHGLTRLPTAGPTHHLLEMQLDMVLTRAWPPAAEASCDLRFLDVEADVPMLDHAFVVCR